MTPRESLYLDSIRTYVLGQIKDTSDIYITSHCGPEFSSAISRTIATKAKITIGTSSQLGDRKYSLIIDCNDDVLKTECITSYKKNLLTGGFIAIGAYNNQYLQKSKLIRDNRFKLNKKIDLIIAKHSLYPVFREPLGKFSHLNTVKNDGQVNRILSKIGNYFPNSKLYSPYTIAIYQIKQNKTKTRPYKSATSLIGRIQRISTRSKILNNIYNAAKSIVFGIFYLYKFRSSIVPSIPSHKQKSGKKTIMVSIQYFGIGGVERVMLNIIKGINRDIFTIHVITTVPSTNPWHKEFEKYADYILHVPEIINEYWPESFKHRYVSEYVKKNGVDVLFITNSTATYKAIPAIKKAFPDTRIYDLLHTHGTPKDNDAYLRISMPFDKYINKRIVIDEYLKKYYTDKYPVNSNKISVIYNSLDKTRVITSANKDTLLESIPKNRKKVTFVGRLDEDKSPMRLVDIAIELKKRKALVSIIVVGDGSLGDEMIKKAAKANVINDYIYFYGVSNNPLSLDEQSDFTLLVSNAEGIPMCALESMSVLTPVISSSVGGMPEIIDHLENGFLVSISGLEERDKITAFTDMIMKACAISNGDYKLMQISANKKIAERFTDMPKIYERLFETGQVI